MKKIGRIKVTVASGLRKTTFMIPVNQYYTLIRKLREMQEQDSRPNSAIIINGERIEL